MTIRKRTQGTLNPYEAGDQKVFDGKRFTYQHKTYHKQAGKLALKEYRKDGYNARIVKAKDYKGGWDIFTRRK
jgi:hypothetical protein